MTLLGYLFGSTLSFEELVDRIPKGLHFTIHSDYKNLSAEWRDLVPADEKIAVAGQLATVEAQTLLGVTSPNAFQVLETKDLRKRFAAVAALYNEGYQPFVPGLTPPTDPEAENSLPLARLIERVEANERRYQEDVSRWLIAAHFFAELQAFRQDNEGFFRYSEPMTPKQAMEGVAIINKWWPWIEVIQKAREKNIQYLDWKALGADRLRF